MENSDGDFDFNKNKEENFDESKNKDGCCNGKNIFVAILKGAGCFLLGVVLTASHYVFDLIAAPLGTILRTIVGCIRLYKKTKPKGFFQHVCYIFKSFFLVIYNLIKLPFLLIYRATFGLIEHAVGIFKPMCCVFRGDKIGEKVKMKAPIGRNKFDFDNDCSNISFTALFAVAFIEFESLLFNDPSKHGKFKRFFTKIWNTVYIKFGNFAAWLLLPKKIDKNTLSTGMNNNSNAGEPSIPDITANNKCDIFNDILHPWL